VGGYFSDRIGELEQTMTRKEIEAELIALVQLHAQRHPGLVVRFVTAVGGKEAYPERECACKAPLGRIAFCYCFCKNDGTAEVLGGTSERRGKARETA
jgi:hypothetical protein